MSKKILMLVGDFSEDYEVMVPFQALLMVGHTVHAVTTVLAAFMLGLGIGGAILGRVARRGGHPLRTYASLEAGIGVSALAVPALLRGAVWLALWMVTPDTPPALVGLVQFAAVFPKAAITQVGMVGDMYLLLSIENTTGETIQVGEVIPSEEQIQFGVIMAKLNTISGSVDVLIGDINKLFTQENINEISQILKNTNKAILSGSEDNSKVAAALRNTTTKIEVMLHEVEDLVKSNKAEVALLLKRAREAAEKAGVTMTAIAKAATTLDKTATTLDGTVKTTEKVIDHQSQNLDVLLTTLTRATEDLPRTDSGTRGPLPSPSSAATPHR